MSPAPIRTTHTGSLPRPAELLALLRAREVGDPYDPNELRAQTRGAVIEAVHAQVSRGIDIVSDGEMGKPGFFQYVHNRIEGIELEHGNMTMRDDPDFPGYWEWRAQHGFGGTLISGWPRCVGPLVHRGTDDLRAEIDDLRAALDTLAAAERPEAFLPAASIGIIAQRVENRYYPTYEAYVEAIAEVMRLEYEAIAAAGFTLQIDAPELAIDRNLPEFAGRPLEDFHARMGLWIDALNFALESVPEEQIRLHICWGNLEAPHVRDTPLEDIVEIVLQAKAGAYSVEAANPRHAHEWRVWSHVTLPGHKRLVPGVIDSTTNFVEHPQVVADRILAYANLVGPERVIAGTDCGFGTSAVSNAVYPSVVWAKLHALAEGAAIASRALGTGGARDAE